VADLISTQDRVSTYWDTANNLRKEIRNSVQNGIQSLEALREPLQTIGTLSEGKVKSDVNKAYQTVEKDIHALQSAATALPDVGTQVSNVASLESHEAAANSTVQALQDFKARVVDPVLQTVGPLQDQTAQLQTLSQGAQEQALSAFQNSAQEYDAFVNTVKPEVQEVYENLKLMANSFMSAADAATYKKKWAARICSKNPADLLARYGAVPEMPECPVAGTGVVPKLYRFQQELNTVTPNGYGLSVTQLKDEESRLYRLKRDQEEEHKKLMLEAGKLISDMKDELAGFKEPPMVRVWNSVNGKYAADSVAQVQEITGNVDKEAVEEARHEARSKAIKYGAGVVGLTTLLYFMYWISKKAYKWYKTRNKKKAARIKKKLKVIKPEKMWLLVKGVDAKGKPKALSQAKATQAQNVILEAMNIKIPTTLKPVGKSRVAYGAKVYMTEDQIYNSVKKAITAAIKAGLVSKVVGSHFLSATKKRLILHQKGKKVKNWNQLTVPILA
jgi:hypothetical protein